MQSYKQAPPRTEDSIVVSKRYIRLTGDFIVAVFLSKIDTIFLEEPGRLIVREGKAWLAKPNNSWENEIFLNENQARRAVGVLKKAGLLDTRVFKFNGTPINHLSLNREALHKALEAQNG